MNLHGVSVRWTRESMNEDKGIEDYRLTQGAIQGRPECRKRLGERLLIVPRILRGLNRRRGQPLANTDIEDLAQDVYVTIWRKLDQFRGEQGLEPWVYRMCQYRLLNQARNQVRERARRESPTGDSLDRLPAHKPHTPHDERLDRIAVQIRQLGPEVREIILLHHVKGLTFQEIANHRKEHVSKLKSQYYRGLVRLRNLIEAGQSQSQSPPAARKP